MLISLLRSKKTKYITIVALGLFTAYGSIYFVSDILSLALKWFTQSTKKSAELQYAVGLMYQHGTGIAN
jgi:TPR repeat protein